MEANKRVESLEAYSHVLRGLINYHKRMMLMDTCYLRDSESGGYRPCKKVDEKGKCPRETAMNDLYLGALEESLRLIEKEIATLEVS